MTELKQPKSCIVSDGRKKVHSVFSDDSELVEEFDVITDELLLRKVRKPNTLGGEGTWVVEVGVDSDVRRTKAMIERELLVEVNGSPELVAQETKEAFVFRIRNLPYPKENFVVSIDVDKSPLGEIVIRTVNKKYFKRLTIPPLVRAKLPLEQSMLKWSVAHNTLLVEYGKSLTIKAKDSVESKERATMKAVRLKDGEQPQCKQQ